MGDTNATAEGFTSIRENVMTNWLHPRSKNHLKQMSFGDQNSLHFSPPLFQPLTSSRRHITTINSYLLHQLPTTWNLPHWCLRHEVQLYLMQGFGPTSTDTQKLQHGKPQLGDKLTLGWVVFRKSKATGLVDGFVDSNTSSRCGYYQNIIIQKCNNKKYYINMWTCSSTQQAASSINKKDMPHGSPCWRCLILKVSTTGLPKSLSR